MKLNVPNPRGWLRSRSDPPSAFWQRSSSSLSPKSRKKDSSLIAPARFCFDESPSVTNFRAEKEAEVCRWVTTRKEKQTTQLVRSGSLYHLSGLYIVSLCSSFRLVWHVLSGDWLTCYWRFSFSLFSLRKIFSFSSFPLVFIFYATFFLYLLFCLRKMWLAYHSISSYIRQLLIIKSSI